MIRDDRTIAVLFVVFALMTFGGTMFDPLSAAWVHDVLGAGAGIYATLMTAHAVRARSVPWSSGRWAARVSPHLLTGWASVVAGALLLVRFNVPS